MKAPVYKTITRKNITNPLDHIYQKMKIAHKNRSKKISSVNEHIYSLHAGWALRCQMLLQEFAVKFS